MRLFIHLAKSTSEQSSSARWEGGYIINLKVAQSSDQGQLQTEKTLTDKEIFPMK